MLEILQYFFAVCHLYFCVFVKPAIGAIDIQSSSKFFAVFSNTFSVCFILVSFTQILYIVCVLHVIPIRQLLSSFEIEHGFTRFLRFQLGHQSCIPTSKSNMHVMYRCKYLHLRIYCKHKIQHIHTIYVVLWPLPSFTVFCLCFAFPKEIRSGSPFQHETRQT